MSLTMTTSPKLLRHALSSSKSSQNLSAPLLVPRDWRVQKVIKRLLNNLHQPHYRDNLAETVSLCPKQLTRVFRQQTGFTPLQYLKRLRLEEAKDLLADFTLSIQEVLQQVGYENASQFSADFKHAFGRTPRQYRQLVLSHQ
ncbi:MAG: AraC family transcriptional regulator [Blastocatellia bacterium]